MVVGGDLEDAGASDYLMSWLLSSFVVEGGRQSKSQGCLLLMGNAAGANGRHGRHLGRLAAD